MAAASFFLAALTFLAFAFFGSLDFLTLASAFFAAVTFFAMLTTSAALGLPGAMLQPLSREFGWSTDQLSSVFAVRFALFGLLGPFAAVFIARFGLRRVMVAAATFIATAMVLATRVTELWHLFVLWGLVLGCGTGLTALVLGAMVANRWFTTRRGLVVGMLAQPALAALLHGPFTAVGIPGGAVPGVCVVVGMLLASAVQMVIGELVPKNWAVSRPLQVARFVVGPQHAFARLFRPVIAGLNAVANRLVRLLGVEPGDRVNLERAVTADKRLGGHIVQGHVDAVGHVVRRQPSEHWEVVEVSMPPELGKYLVDKGSITVDGVSLTVVEAGPESFTVSLIPETLARTTLGTRQPGDRVNLEVDVLAKHVEKLLSTRGEASA